jgi:hypothetical protein
MPAKKKLTNNKLKPTVYKVSTLSSTSKPAKKKPATKPAKKNTLINRIKEDWSKPIGGYNPDKGTWFPPADDKYPHGSLTGRGQNKKKKKK